MSVSMLKIRRQASIASVRWARGCESQTETAEIDAIKEHIEDDEPRYGVGNGRASVTAVGDREGLRSSRAVLTVCGLQAGTVGD